MKIADLKLSPTQKRAFEKLLDMPEEWECSYSLHESISTMRALVKKGLVASRGGDRPGAFSMSAVAIEYRAKYKRTVGCEHCGVAYSSDTQDHMSYCPVVAGKRGLSTCCDAPEVEETGFCGHCKDHATFYLEEGE